MATVTAFIRTTRKKTDTVNIRFRLRDGRNTQLFHASDISVNPAHWDEGRQELKARVVISDTYRNKVNTSVAARKKLLLEAYTEIKDNPTPERWYEAIDIKLNPSKYKPKERTFFDIFDEFIETQTSGQNSHLKVLRRTLRRWEMYRQTTENEAFKIDINKLTDRDLTAFDRFLETEYKLQDNYPEIYQESKETRRVAQRGNNVRSSILKRFRTFYHWAVRTDKSTNNPFDDFKAPQEVYGTPYFISVKERDKLLHTRLDFRENTAVQRDIFIFQCLIGCRVSDLTKLTKSNIKDNGNFLEYIPRKTKDEKPVTVRVPLTKTAKELILKYDGVDKNGRLFPFISAQKYNEAIKEAFTLAKLNRLVTVRNSVTGEEEQRPLNEVASSHLARRTFVGNLYKRVKDPNLIGSMSGHVEGSKAFARYRDIDDDMKTETINLLEI